MEIVTDAQLVAEISKFIIDDTGYGVILDDKLITKIIAIVRENDAKGVYTMEELLNNIVYEDDHAHE